MPIWSDLKRKGTPLNPTTSLGHGLKKRAHTPNGHKTTKKSVIQLKNMIFCQILPKPFVDW